MTSETDPGGRARDDRRAPSRAMAARGRHRRAAHRHGRGRGTRQEAPAATEASPASAVEEASSESVRVAYSGVKERRIAYRYARTMRTAVVARRASSSHHRDTVVVRVAPHRPDASHESSMNAKTRSEVAATSTVSLTVWLVRSPRSGVLVDAPLAPLGRSRLHHRYPYARRSVRLRPQGMKAG